MGSGNCREQSRKHLRGDSVQWGCWWVFNKTITENSQNRCVFMTSHRLRQVGLSLEVKVNLALSNCITILTLSKPPTPQFPSTCALQVDRRWYHLGSLSSVFDYACYSTHRVNMTSALDTLFFSSFILHAVISSFFLSFFHDRDTKKPHKRPDITVIYNQIASPNWFKLVAINQCYKDQVVNHVKVMAPGMTTWVGFYGLVQTRGWPIHRFGSLICTIIIWEIWLRYLQMAAGPPPDFRHKVKVICIWDNLYLNESELKMGCGL